MRLIDADALMMHLADIKLTESPDERDNSYYKRDRQLAVMVGIEYAEDAVKEAPTVGGWVSVKDRMPPDGQFVLVCNDDGHMMVGKYESETLSWYYKYINYDFDVWDDDEQGPVCYWMPLPKPPEDE